jgi:acyl carrier protein
MERHDIATKLRSFIETEFPIQGIELTDDTDLLEDWFVDSLGIVETVMFIEVTFGARIARKDINAANFRSIATLTDFLVQHLAD